MNSSSLQVQAKPVINDLERITNTMLSDINIENFHDPYESKKICQQGLPWKDKEFWKELPRPNSKINRKKTGNNRLIKSQKQLLNLEEFDNKNQLQLKSKKNTQIVENLKLLKKCFNIWRTRSKSSKNHKQRLNEQIEQKEKITRFLKMLKKCKNKQKTVKLERNYKQEEEIKSTSVSPNTGCYKHRFKTQQDIIQLQKLKLLRQEKIIQDLRLGKLTEDIDRSIEETQKQIQETLIKCAVKTRCNVRTVLESPEGESPPVNFRIDTAKAPKIVHKMEKRAQEREHKRQIILEKKRLLDMEKKQAIEMEIEKKRALDEEERKKTLREIKEQRRKQLEIQQKIRIKQEEFLKNCCKADDFYINNLKMLGLKGFRKLIATKECNDVKSEEFYTMNLKKRSWLMWTEFILKIQNRKMQAALDFYKLKLKKVLFKVWFNEYTISIQHMQVADDLYEMRLQNRMIIHWHRYVCVQYVRESKNIQRAKTHYIKLILHYFYLWKTFPLVIRLEKAKEEKKLRWRQKVWEILPDYNPIIDD